MDINQNNLRLLVVIINYKTPDLIEGALRSLEKEIDPLKDSVVVVDNFSNDGSIEKISSFIKKNQYENWVNLISSPINGGFSAGNNIGIKSRNSDYYLLLNSDAYVRPGAIKTMIKSIEEHKKIGILGPRIEWEDGIQQVSCFNNLTPMGEFLKSTNTGFITKFFSLFGVKETAQKMQNMQMHPDWLSFACVLIKKEVIASIGLMDENYFMYREDNDYCIRANTKEWEILHEPKARVVHLNQGYSNKTKIRYPDYFYRSRSLYFIKFYGRIGLFFANIVWTFGRIISGLREILTAKKTDIHPLTFLDMWKGFWQ